MRLEDAPPAGWYPDPEGGSRLRYWEGADWADRWRAPPTAGVVRIRAQEAEEARHEYEAAGGYVNYAKRERQETEEVISQVRQAARSEAERAVSMFRREAQNATRNITPLITEYTNRFMRWVRIVSVLAIVLLVAWVAWQIFVQASLFDWIGDRIDNLTDNGTSNEPVEGWIRPLLW